MRKPATKTTRPALLSGGNPRVAKADGDSPVQTCITAMPGWKHENDLDERRLAPWIKQAAAIPGWGKS